MLRNTVPSAGSKTHLPVGAALHLNTTSCCRHSVLLSLEPLQEVQGAQLLCPSALRACRHVLEVHRAATQRREVAEEEAREEAFFKRYLEFCRARVSPRLSEPAADSLVSQYVELREQVSFLTALLSHRNKSMDARRVYDCDACSELLDDRSSPSGGALQAIASLLAFANTHTQRGCSVTLQQGRQRTCARGLLVHRHASTEAMPATQGRAAARENESDTPVVPITVRQLEAVVRIAESYARLQLQVKPAPQLRPA